MSWSKVAVNAASVRLLSATSWYTPAIPVTVPPLISLAVVPVQPSPHGLQGSGGPSRSRPSTP
ncbi:hypothetical protein ACWGET_17975 [Streptomyces zaomyceticus]|uniref:hypothetical protein n=1 Tax=Streptomyces zaomyceticus TaxID=68286 RepID=UPI0035DA3878